MSDFYAEEIGAPANWTAGAFSFSSFALNQATDALEFIFQARDAITITKGVFRYTSRTGTPPTYQISLQGVDGSGNPDGTIKGGGSPVQATFTPPANATWDGTVRRITFDNAYAAGRGEWLAMVIKYSAGAVDASNFSTITARTDYLEGIRNQPYAIQNDNGTRTRQTFMPIFGYESASRVYGRPLKNTVAGTAVQETSTPDEVGMKFTLPAAWGTTYKVVGLRVNLNIGNNSSWNWRLYDTDGSTVLQNVDVDSDFKSAGNIANNVFFFDETTLSSLSFGSTYRLSLLGPTGVNQTLNYIEADQAADWDAWPGGQIYSWTERTDAGAWTDTAVRRPLMALIIDDWTATGGGGPVGSGRLSGGLQ